MKRYNSSDESLIASLLTEVKEKSYIVDYGVGEVQLVHILFVFLSLKCIFNSLDTVSCIEIILTILHTE